MHIVYIELFQPFFIVCLAVHSMAEAEPEAEPAAEAQAEPQEYDMNSFYPGASQPAYGANPNGAYVQQPNDFYPGASRPPYNPDPMPRPPYNPDPMPRPPYNPDPMPRPPYNPDPRPPYNPEPCQMAEECCGMIDQNCCPESKPEPPQQNCYWYWDKECYGDAICNRTKVAQHCDYVTVPNCVVDYEYTKRTFESERCKKYTVPKCFTYKKEECKMTSRKVTETVLYQTEEIVRQDDVPPKEKCVPVYGKKCVPYLANVTQTIVEIHNRTIKIPNTQCRWKPVKLPGRTIKVKVPYITYQKMCYKMPVPVCNTMPCQNQGYCEENTSPCSTNTYPTQVCPSPAPGTFKRM